MRIRRQRRGRRQPSRPRSRVIGISVLVVLVLVVYAVFVRQVPWQQSWTLKAIFANSAQITAGSPVRIAGLDVGKVSGVSRGPGTTALVTMAIGSGGRPIHADATVEIRPRLFLEGSYYVSLSPGSPSSPILGSGHTLPLPQTQIPVSFSTVLSTFTAPVRQDLINIIDGFSHGLADGAAADLGSGITQLAPALRDTAIVSQALIGTGSDDVTQLIEGADRATGALASQAPALSAGIAAEASLADALASRDAQITASIRGVDATLISAPPEITAISGSLAPLQRFAVGLDPSLRRAPAVLTETSALLDQLRLLVAPGAAPRLVAQLGPLSTQVSALAPKLDDLFPRVQEIASCTANQLVGLLDTKLQDGNLTTGQTVWQELAHVNVGLASANQDFDAAGTSVRFATNLQPNLLGVGSVPGVGALLQNTEQPLLGIRPEWTGTTPPPVHPEVPCTTQPLGDLQAAADAIPATPSARVTLNLPKLSSLLKGSISRVDARLKR
jgi:phospholipid/cholesterol/gamma-HCH transport system substrate-binding protein